MIWIMGQNVHKLWGVADMPEGHAAIQCDFNRLEKQADKEPASDTGTGLAHSANV